ncbi:MAG: hypothetical protein K9W46_11445 [Candidatus Heimdallarchaeum endolithica]|uniref:Uncharacterized protein n=1 Tax=Candidatus Heimdallarchaeum endolithica TaxID=2876572 RepID=A0A9Y1BQB6_9ARCH|nr:MAG: hypothetical protein K9W46_11445 [Candidatus Heimdallarchaeum endolithica]
MVRIRDADFNANWNLELKKTRGFQIIQILHLLFGFIALLLVLIQSILSENVIIFTVWLSFAIILLLIDISHGSNIKIQDEMTFFGLVLLGTLFSMYFANIESMFFIDNLNQLNIISYQIMVGVSISLRLFLAIYFESLYSKEFKVLHPKTIYSSEQLEMYKSNLLKTNFSVKQVRQLDLKEQFYYLVSKIFVPIIIIGFFVLLSYAYAYFIYLLLPNDVLKEFIVKPAFIVFSLLFSFILVRVANSLPELIKKSS